MLIIEVPGNEFYDSVSETFITYSAQTIELEHSLVAISKWESKWMKPFLGNDDKTTEEIYDYVACMITNNVIIDIAFMQTWPKKIIDTITNYIQCPMTATKITQQKSKATREIITSELIYYWMLSFNIPFECQHWHINRLLMLINVCNIKNTPPKKENKKDILARNRALNEARKKSMQTSG